jgi:hypothetical protein
VQPELDHAVNLADSCLALATIAAVPRPTIIVCLRNKPILSKQIALNCASLRLILALNLNEYVCQRPKKSITCGFKNAKAVSGQEKL